MNGGRREPEDWLRRRQRRAAISVIEKIRRLKGSEIGIAVT